jgi:hypothetical protein
MPTPRPVFREEEELELEEDDPSEASEDGLKYGFSYEEVQAPEAVSYR